MPKFSIIPALFDSLRNALEKAPEIAHAAAETGVATGIAAALAPAALPLAIAGPAIVEQYTRHRESRPDEAALAELFRKALLTAVKEISDDAPEHFTEADRGLIELWSDGLAKSGKDEPYWARLLEEEIPDQTSRLIGLDLRNAPSNWPALRAFLECATAWFRYRRTSTSTTIIASTPTLPLNLSPYAESYLAVNLTTALVQEFRKDLTAGENETAFRQALLRQIAQLAGALAPLDPLTPIGDFPSIDDVETEVQLLNARYRAIPYIGRAGDIESLFEWLHGPRPVSFLAVDGRGGSGKTRFAYQFLELLEQREPYVWHAGMLDLKIHPDALSRERFQKWRGRRPTLIVIDYAAAHAEELAAGVEQLYSSTMKTRRGEAPLRFLLLERTCDPNQGWYKSLLSAARDRVEIFFPKPPLRLEPLSVQDRFAVLDAGLEAAYQFDQRPSGHQLPRLPLLPPDEMELRLEAKKTQDPLVLLMAALVAHNRQDLSPLNLDRMELAGIVANRERLRIETLAARKEPLFPLHLAALITLTGSLSSADVELLCEAESEALKQRTWETHELVALLSRRALPAFDVKFAVDPIQPDVVGESFVLDVLREDGHNPGAAVARAARRKPGPVVRSLVHMVQDFAPPAEAAEIKSSEQRWALDLLTTLLASNAGNLPDAGFWEIRAALPLETVAIREAALNFYRIVLGSREAAGDRGGVWLVSKECFAIHACALGQHAVALRYIGEVVAIRRKLAEGDPDAFLSDLAGSLNNQALWQGEMGQRGEALRSIAEAVAICRALAKAKPDVFLPGLAMSLNNLAMMQGEMRQRDEAFRSITEAIAIYRKLAAADPDVFLPNLARSLNNQANSQSEMGKRCEALRSIAEAVGTYRKLAGANPDSFLPDLAQSLNNLASRQSEMGQPAKALGSIAEAVAIRRKLAEANPDAFLPYLAASLNNQASRQNEMGQRAEALHSIGEAVAICRKLVEANPDAFLVTLVGALNDQAVMQSWAGQLAEALRSLGEAVANCRKLAEADPDQFLPDLAMSLNNQANSQSAMGRLVEALRSIGEAVAIRRKFAETNPAYLPDLASALNNQANVQGAIGMRAEALRSIAEVVAIYRKLGEANPDAFVADLAMSNGVWGKILTEIDPIAAAEKFADGIKMIAAPAKQLPQAHLPLALAMARDYLQACESAKIVRDPKILDHIAAFLQLQELMPGNES